MVRRSVGGAQRELSEVMRALHGVDNANGAAEWDETLDLDDRLGRVGRSLRARNIPPNQVVNMLLARLGVADGSPWWIAGDAIAREAGIAVPEAPYHNPQHICEMLSAAYCLGIQEGLPKDRLIELILAACAHDLGHPGSINSFPYELESRSFSIAQPLLEKAGVKADAISRIEAMILATDFRDGVQPARDAYLDLRSLSNNDPRRLLAAQRVLLTEADVLFSCFDEQYNDVLSRLLAAEWRRGTDNLPFKDRIGFVGVVRFVSDAAAAFHLEQRRLRLRDTLAALQSESESASASHGARSR